MPLIKSAKKQMKVSRKKQQRNYRTREKLKNSLKDVVAAVKDGKKPEAEKAMQAAYKVIDTAAKKNILHKNTANRKKAGVAKMVANIDKTPTAATKPAKKAAPKKAAAPKKEEPKAEATEEVKGEKAEEGTE